MLLVPCPHCGPRNSADLRYLGETPPRPDPAVTDGTDGTEAKASWRDYLYLRHNPADWLTEMWYCRSGCRRYFTVERHTVTNEFRQSPLPFAKGARS